MANRGADSAWGGGDRQKVYDEIRRENEQYRKDLENPEFASYQPYRRATPRAANNIALQLHAQRSDWQSVMIEEVDSEDMYERFGGADVYLELPRFEISSAEALKKDKARPLTIPDDRPAGYVEVEEKADISEVLSAMLAEFERLEMSDYTEDLSYSGIHAILWDVSTLSNAKITDKGQRVTCTLVIKGRVEATNSKGRTRERSFGLETEVSGKFFMSPALQQVMKKGDELFYPVPAPQVVQWDIPEKKKKKKDSTSGGDTISVLDLNVAKGLSLHLQGR